MPGTRSGRNLFLQVWGDNPGWPAALHLLTARETGVCYYGAEKARNNRLVRWLLNAAATKTSDFARLQLLLTPTEHTAVPPDLQCTFAPTVLNQQGSMPATASQRCP